MVAQRDRAHFQILNLRKIKERTKKKRETKRGYYGKEINKERKYEGEQKSNLLKE